MDTRTTLAQALHHKFPPDLQEQAPLLARVLADVIAGHVTPEVAQAALTADAALQSALAALAGQTVTGGGVRIDFGAENRTGDVTIGEVAGRALVKLTVHLGPKVAAMRQALYPALARAARAAVNSGYPQRAAPLLPLETTPPAGADALLAGLLHALGRVQEEQLSYAAARPLLARALAITEQALGPAHPHTATCLNNLAWLCSNEGQLDEAAALLLRALAIPEAALGPQHPDTQASRALLAAIEDARRQGRDESP